jgi:hypothetical protein
MHKKIYNYLYWTQVVIVALVLLGLLPREMMFIVTAAIVGFVLWRPVEDGATFFVQSIPLFLALPITESFDNFNAWRIIIAMLFAKWFVLHWKEYWQNRHHKTWQHFAGEGLLIIACLSLIHTPDLGAGIKRIIYFVNLSLIGVIIFDLVKKNREFASRLIHAIRIPTMIVIAVGFLQVISTYFIDVYQFMRIWGEGIQCNQFGREWCYIAVNVGNTWLAYFGDQLSLRVFSLFPDSHSFPQFVLLGIPTLFAYGITNITSAPDRLQSLIKTVRTRGRIAIVWVPLAFLIAILSGTRGIWAAYIGVLFGAAAFDAVLVKAKIDRVRTTLYRYTMSFLVIFPLLFFVAYPIFTSPQFLVSKGNFGLFGSRIKSVIDFGETSNSQRIIIWKKSLTSIKENPFLGVGIGNFPVILGEDARLARAGSSAHNIYLHIASEMGIPALLIVIALLVNTMWRLFKAYVKDFDPLRSPYLAMMFHCFPWVLIYSLTDVALFDERSFLLFVTTIGLIGALGHEK